MDPTTNPWTDLLGNVTLLSHNGDPQTPTSLSSKSGVMLYFSAHWCGPCRGFTPNLVEYYKSHKDKFNFEIIFISSDRDQDSFDQYWGEMPWLALGFDNRDLKNKLSKKYKVQGIPSLVVLDGNANTITMDGRGKVSSQPDNFPWTPKTFSQIVSGNVIDGQDKEVSIESLKSNTAIGIYFSAHWCPPCKGFTPNLIKTYNKIKSDGKKFEIIFATSDHDDPSFKSYFHEMPWLAFPYKDKRIDELSELYGVEGIPFFVVVDPTNGKVINSSGRSAVSSDPEGVDFPWYPKPLNSVENASDKINDESCLIYIDSNIGENTISALNKVATTYWDQWKAEGKEQFPLYFYYGKDGNLAKRIKEFTKVDSDPSLIILDISGTRKFISVDSAGTEANFNTFVSSFLAGTLVEQPL